MNCHNFLVFICFFATVTCAAQKPFKYKRAVTGVDVEGWYALNLPADIFKDLSQDFSDIRLYSIENGDTLEIPYLMDIQNDVISDGVVVLSTFNRSYRDGVLFLTFEQRPGQKVNHLDLTFSELNYFGRVSLEGSDDRKKWYQVIRDQRILSVRKNNGDYTLSRISFPLTDYRFLRAQISADVPLTFQRATFRQTNVQRGNFLELPVQWTSRVERKTKQTVVDVKLQHLMPVTSLAVKTDTASDYYRPLRIEYVSDSFRTERGWMKRYETLYEGHLTSFRPNIFNFPWKLVREVRFVITNNDNQPVQLHEVKVRGPQVRMLAHLEPNVHVMMYGLRDMRPPTYDLAYFKNKIPDSVNTAQLQPADVLSSRTENSSPLFENKLWLWTILVVMVVGLGGFTIKMMSEKRDAKV